MRVDNTHAMDRKVVEKRKRHLNRIILLSSLVFLVFLGELRQKSVSPMCQTSRRGCSVAKSSKSLEGMYDPADHTSLIKLSHTKRVTCILSSHSHRLEIEMPRYIYIHRHVTSKYLSPLPRNHPGGQISLPRHIKPL